MTATAETDLDVVPLSGTIGAEIRGLDLRRVDDATVAAAIVVSGSAEAGGEGNRRWCELFHREVRPAAMASRHRRPAVPVPPISASLDQEASPGHDPLP